MSKTSENTKTNKPNVEPINRDKSALASKITRIVENGRKEIKTKSEIEKYPIGSLISYMNKSGVFKTAGYIKCFGDDHFIYMSKDFGKKVKVKYENVDKMWVGDVYKTKNDIVSITPTTNKKTQYYAKIGDVVVYYAPTISMVSRHKHTVKYQRLAKWYELFGDN
jgi:hypothetical protein